MISSTKTKERRVIVDPTFPIEWRDVDDFLNEFGPYNGRYVPSYPNDWAKRLRAHVDELDLPPLKRHALLTKILGQAKLCTVNQNWEWDDGKLWKENVGHLAADLGDAIVVGDAIDPHPFNSWQDVVDEIRSSRVRSWSFDGTVTDYQELCRPLLLASPAAYLVDPYLNPFDFETELLIRKLLDTIKGSRCYSVEIITRWKTHDVMGKRTHTADAAKSLENDLAQHYQRLIPKGCTLKLHYVVEARDTNALQLHDRFFLTKYGAINFGHGFRIVGKGAPQINAFIVDAGHHNTLKQIYINGVAHCKEQLPRSRDVPKPRDVITLAVKG